MQPLAGLGRHYMAFIVGVMLVLVVAGGMYAIRQASHYTRDNTLVNTPISQTTR